MNTFQMILTNEREETITITTGSYGELMGIVDRLKPVGWFPKPWHNAVARGSGNQTRQAVPNVPANIPVCPHHPDAGMGHDSKNPGQYYCKGKVDGKWCGYKANKSGLIRPSILDNEEEAVPNVMSNYEIDF